MLYTKDWVIDMATFKEISIECGYPAFIPVPFLGGIKFFNSEFTPLETIRDIWAYIGKTGENTVYLKAPASYEDGLYDMLFNTQVSGMTLKDLLNQNDIDVPEEYNPGAFCKMTKEIFNHCLLFLVACTSIHDNITLLKPDTEMNVTVDEFRNLMNDDLKMYFDQIIGSLLHFKAKTDPEYVYREDDYNDRILIVSEYIKSINEIQTQSDGYTSI